MTGRSCIQKLMTSSSQVSKAGSGWGSLKLTQTLWYAASTASRHEKRIAEQLQQRNIEYFLPLYESTHRWSNGNHRVQLPLFPGYIFLHIALAERLRALEIPGVVRLVGFSGVPFPLEESEIDGMRAGLQAGLRAQPHPYLTRGARVEIIRGPLQGMTGILLRHRGSLRVVISVDLIMRSMLVEVDLGDVVPLRHLHGKRQGLVPGISEIPQAVQS